MFNKISDDFADYLRDSPHLFQVRFWHSADTSALPHPGIIKLSFDIPYQLLLIPF